jgi:hypothetical protein
VIGGVSLSQWRGDRWLSGKVGNCWFQVRRFGKTQQYGFYVRPLNGQTLIADILAITGDGGEQTRGGYCLIGHCQVQGDDEQRFYSGSIAKWPAYVRRNKDAGRKDWEFFVYLDDAEHPCDPLLQALGKIGMDYPTNKTQEAAA